jgi:tight adherence protein C
MLDIVFALAFDPFFIMGALTALGVSATIITIALPLMERDELKTRMRAVSIERERIRARERARLKDEKVMLRVEPKAYMRALVERFDLKRALADSGTADRLRSAGFRGQAPLTVFLFARFTLPFAAFFIALIYLFVLNVTEWSTPIKLIVSLVALGIGFYLPNIYVTNAIGKRQQSIRRAWPDALDLLLICVESGMAIEGAFRKVAEEIGGQSVALAEEMSLTTAELSYLPERRKAYENLSERTGLDQVKAVVTALVQAERYGTPLGTALRVLSQESRDQRMMEAEKKAAALPPMLTVPMIVFFLPVLFVVIMGPAAIQIMKLN